MGFKTKPKGAGVKSFVSKDFNKIEFPLKPIKLLEKNNTFVVDEIKS